MVGLLLFVIVIMSGSLMFTKIVAWVAAKATEYLLTKELGNSPCHNDVKPQVRELVRLRPDVLERLEREVAQPYVSPTTTDIMAGYLLGVQAVLQKLRSGYATD